MENKLKQLVCPKCKYEFQYNEGEIGKRMAILVIELRDLQKQLAEHKTKPREEQFSPTNNEWRRKAIFAYNKKSEQYAQLKQFRKLANEQKEINEFSLWKRVVKDRFGEIEYKKCWNEVNELMAGETYAQQMNISFNSRKDGTIIKKVV